MSETSMLQQHGRQPHYVLPGPGAIAPVHAAIPRGSVVGGLNIIGSAPIFQRLLRMVEAVAPTRSTVLISGPTGSGKEIIAQLVHRQSGDPGAPFVDLNCGALPEHLIDAELFGHTKGAFTGAFNSRAGFFAQAGQGTLFLDEIGELPLAVQSKLLRVLESRCFRPLGGGDTQPFNGRIVAATHCDLAAMVQAGRFREDLYYRLAVVKLDVPGLDQRRSDVAALAAHFASQQKRPIRFTATAVERLCRHVWPGHIRKLRNLIERLSILAESALIDAHSLEAFLSAGTPEDADHTLLAEALMRLDGDDKLAAAQQLLIDYAMRIADGNKTIAARHLGINRKVIERRLHGDEERSNFARVCLLEGRALIEAARFKEAIEVLRRGLTLLAADAHPCTARRLSCDLHRWLAISHRGISGWQSAEALACYQQALQEAAALGDEVEITALRFGIWSSQLMALDLVAARATAQDMLQRAQAIGDTDLLSQAHLALANTLFWLGDYRETLACLERGHLLCGAASTEAGGQGLDIAGLSATFEGLSHFQGGAFRRARLVMEQLILRGSTDNPHPFHRVIALQGAAWLACMFEDWARLANLAADLKTVASEYGYQFYLGVGQIFHACALAPGNAHAQTEQRIADGYQHYMLCEGGMLFHSFQAWKRGELLLSAGQPLQARQLLHGAIEMALEHGERAYLVELLDMHARTWIAVGDLDNAERELGSALSTAKALGAAAGSLLVATRLAQLLLQRGRRPEALAHLTRALRSVEPDTAFPRFAQALQLQATLAQAISMPCQPEDTQHELSAEPR